ncbi:MAG: hypothetical protein OXR67_11925 [Chloroflexota bacterium]|nr:hypothetical protein [Chloroflexota bacterium]
MPFLLAELVIDRPEMADLAAPIAGHLGFPLYVEDTPNIREFREMLDEFG